MNAKEAIQHLHERHPLVVDAPDDELAPGGLQLEFYWFQGHVCDLIDERQERALKRSFETMHQVVVRGDDVVKNAVYGDFVQPELIFHPDLEWAKEHMPELLADMCALARKTIDQIAG